MEIQLNQDNSLTTQNEKNQSSEPCVELLQCLGQLGNDSLATREKAQSICNISKMSLPLIIDKFVANLKETEDLSYKELGIKKVQELSLSMMDSIRPQDKLAGIQFLKELIQRNDKYVLTTIFEDAYFQELKKLFKHQDIKIRTNISQIIGDLIKYNYKKYFAVLFEFCIIEGNQSVQALQNLPNEVQRDTLEPKNIQEISQYLEKQQMNLISEQVSFIDAILQYMCCLLNNFPKEEQLLKEQIIQILNLINSIQFLEKKHLKTYGFELIMILFEKILVNQVIELKEEWNQLLATGIEDSNAEVRFKALLVVREYMKKLKQNSDPSAVYKLFLPKICFNRYYPASSLSQLSQEIWKEVVDKNGRQLLIQYSDDTLSFYLKQLIAHNWEVRQTACLVISEFCSKVANDESSHKSLLKYLKAIIENLQLCLNDQHLQVRIDAFNLVDIIFPEIYYLSKEEQFQIEDKLEEILIIHLADIQSIKERTSKLLAKIFTKREETLDKVLVKLEELFKKDSQFHSHCNHEDVKVVIDKTSPNLCEQHYHQGDLIEGALRFFNLIVLPNIKDKQKLARQEQFVQLLGKYFYHIQNENNSQIKSTIWTLLQKGIQQIGKDTVLMYGNEFLWFGLNGLESQLNNKMQQNEQNSAKSFIQTVGKMLGDEQLTEMLQKMQNGDQIVKFYLEKVKI